MEPTPRSPEEIQKLIGRVTRFAGLFFFILGGYILATGGDMILGSALLLLGLTDIVLMPRILEKIITEKLKQQNQPKQQD